MQSSHSLEVFVDRADQHLPPEPVDNPVGLPLFLKPLRHGDAVEVATPGALAPQRQQCARQGAFSPQVRQRMEANDSAKCAGAGSQPRFNTDTLPPGSIKENCRWNRISSCAPNRR
jgi:hypothetical protein